MRQQHVKWAEELPELQCEHKRTEIRRKAIAGGRFQAREQCLDCGDAGEQICKLHEATGDFDEAALRAFRDKAFELYGKRNRNRVDAFAQQRAEQDRAWWDNYNAYLRSGEWLRSRAYVLMRDRNECQARLAGCISRATQAHHVNYKTFNAIGETPTFDLVAVCVPCHEKLTEASRLTLGSKEPT